MIRICDRCREIVQPPTTAQDMLALLAASLVIVGALTVLSAMLRLIPKG